MKWPEPGGNSYSSDDEQLDSVTTSYQPDAAEQPEGESQPAVETQLSGSVVLVSSPSPKLRG